MKRDWNNKQTTIQIRQIVQHEDVCGITFTPEMLEHLNVAVGEDVQVVMTENDLIIRKILPPNYPDSDSENYYDILNESTAKYDTTVKDD